MTIALLALLGGCAADSAGDTAPTSAASQTTLESSTSSEPVTTQRDTPTPSAFSSAPASPTSPTSPTTATTGTPVAAGWASLTAAAPCECSDGSPFTYFLRPGNPDKVLFFLQGGGACFSAETCSPQNPLYKRNTAEDNPDRLTMGIFDNSRADNPFADYSVVYVPYCTGDVHIGNAEHDYGAGNVVRHRGYRNVSAAMDTLVERFPTAEQIVVAGSSAGSIGTPLYAGLLADRLPSAAITVLADGSGAYPDVPIMNETIGSLWGVGSILPDWPEYRGLRPDQFSIPGMFIQSGHHAPRIVFARYDYAFDHTQEFFAGLAGVAPDRLVELIDRNEAQIESTGVTVHSYTAPGDRHTILELPGFYEEAVGGTAFVDWVSTLLSGSPPADVHCADACR